MKRIGMGAVMALLAVTAMSQETYESAQLASTDLNGTARYVGMGGAMEALGADISTMGSNPAGVGLFRRSWVGASGGATIQSGNDGVAAMRQGRENAVNADFNQIGFVYSMKPNEETWINMGFNFNKSRNFNQILTATNSLYDASASKASFIAFTNRVPYNMDKWVDSGADVRWYNASQMEDMNDAVVISPLGGYSAADGYGAMYDRHGYIGNFDFNISANINDRVYVGFTFGLKRVSYYDNYYYNEGLVDMANMARGVYSLVDERRIDGSGIDVKAGAIFRPMEESPFRIGVYVHTPTWYSLTSENRTVATSLMRETAMPLSYGFENIFDYKITTPWVFGLSLGHTFGDKVAIGATYEFADYSSIGNRYVSDTYRDYVYDYWYDYEYVETYYNYSSDGQMNRNTRQCLKGVHTAKVGVEVKPTERLSLRTGYNYVSPMCESDASKDLFLDNGRSNGGYYANYGFVNWRDTHRFTFGVGYALTDRLSLDMAYQYSMQKGDYHPFPTSIDALSFTLVEGSRNYNTGLETNIGTACAVHYNRHQLNMTLGYRF